MLNKELEAEMTQRGIDMVHELMRATPYRMPLKECAETAIDIISEMVDCDPPEIPLHEAGMIIDGIEKVYLT